jgi:hypothetical protein
MTAKMNMMMSKTKVRLERAPSVFIIILRMSLRDFHDLANLKTLRSRNDRSMESPETPSARSSTKESMTIRKSKMFQPSCNRSAIIVGFKGSLRFRRGIKSGGSVFFRQKGEWVPIFQPGRKKTVGIIAIL